MRGGRLLKGGAPALSVHSTFRREFLTMADKMFHLRANEVRAESRVLMQKLRAERLAKTRHRPRPVVEIPSAVSVKPVVHEARPVASILPSRKIQAAVDTQLPDVIEEIAPTLFESKPQRVKKVKSAPMALVEPLPASSAEMLPLEALTDSPVVMPQAPEPPQVEIQPKAKTRTKKISVDAMPVAPLTEASHSEKSEPKKPEKRKKSARSVAEIIEQGLGSVADLQEVVALAVAATPEPIKAEPAPVSPRAKEPIASVPTLGPGMIWRLNQLGIQTLGDLAALEVDDLRGKLGPVAKLVRVENWIAYARAA